MKSLLLVCLFFFLYSNGLVAQEVGMIKGVVRDSQTNEPLANVNLMVTGTHRGDVSNYAGEFTISRVPVGQHIIRASLLGYAVTEIKARIPANQTTVIDLELNEDEAIRVEEIVVSATRANSYPQTSLSAQDVARRSPKDVGEFLRTIPGASSIRKGGTAMDPVIRGFRQDQLNVQVDGGMKVWGACPNRMDPPTSHIQAEDLEKIEVIKGPFAVRFGPTFGAVVNLVMEKPEQFDKPGFRTRAEGGYESNGDGKRSRATLAAGAPMIDMLVSGGTKDYDGYRGGDGSEVQSGFRMRDYSVKLGFNPGDRQRVQITNRGSFMRDVYYPALPMDAYRDDTHMYALDYANKSVSNTVSSFSAKAYGAYVHHIMGNQWKPTYASLHSKADVESQTLGGKVEAMLVPTESGFLYVGVDGYDLMKSGDRVREFVAGPNKGKTFLDTLWQDSHIRNVGAYAEGRAFLTKDVTTIAGVRLDHVIVKSDKPNFYFSSNFAGLLDATENNVSGVAAILYTLNPSVDMRFGVGHGVRTADITERFVYIQPIGMDRYDYIGNPGLQPEQNTQLELDANARISRISLHASAYHSFLRNYISARMDTTVKPLSADVLGVKRFVNVSDASMTGFELSASSSIVSDLRLDLSAAYTYGQDRDSKEPLAEMPPLTGVALLHFQQPEESPWAELEGQFVAKQSRISTAFQEQVTPGFAVYSLRAGSRLFDHLNVTLAVTNIFDKSYYEHLNRKSKANGLPILEPGRSFSINAQIYY
jgi:iron complex outermembrane receptor protein